MATQADVRSVATRSPPKLMEDEDGMVFEYLAEQEAEFLYEEIFVRRSYLRHELSVVNNSVVFDVGANLGFFSLQCLREAKNVQVIACEPIPPIYDVLVRNLKTFEAKNSGPRPMSLQVALGAEQGQQEFVYYDSSPGESTRHPEEREELKVALLTDEDAKSWQQALSGGALATAAAYHGEKRTAVASPSNADSDLGCVGVGGKDEHPAAEGDSGTRRLRRKGQTFLCNVVPLSLALGELCIGVVDLLKVDVEGDELAILQGISADDWPKIRQVVLEVHDVDDRLASTVELLQSEPAGFDHVCWEMQETSEVGGYVMVIPHALRLFLVFAKRRTEALNSDDGLPQTSSADSGVCLNRSDDDLHTSSVSRAQGSGGHQGNLTRNWCCCPSRSGNK